MYLLYLIIALSVFSYKMSPNVLSKGNTILCTFLGAEKSHSVPYCKIVENLQRKTAIIGGVTR